MEARRAKRFLLGERTVELEQLAGDQWRVLVDGRPVPMTFRETESTATNSGHYDKELRAEHPVAALPLGPCVRQEAAFEPGRSKSGWRAVCCWKARMTEMYNTAIYDLEYVELSFPPDCSSVAVGWDHHTDSSS